MLLVFTGNGKGKTTAALGNALRILGADKRAVMVQFIKGPWRSGEHKSVERLAPDFKIIKTGKGFVGILGDTLPIEEHQKAAEEGFNIARKEMLDFLDSTQDEEKRATRDDMKKYLQEESARLILEQKQLDQIIDQLMPADAHKDPSARCEFDVSNYDQRPGGIVR